MLTAAAASLAVLLAQPVGHAGTFEIKGPAIEAGETELSTNHAFQAGFPRHADRVGHSFDTLLAYGFSEHFKAAIKGSFDTPVGDGTRLSTAGVELQLSFGKIAPSISVGWFSGLDVQVHRDESHTVLFGPLVQFGDDKLSLTFNTFLEKSFGPNRDPGVAFVYSTGLKAAVREGLALGIEAHGTITDIGNGSPVDLQEHRIGPVVYLEREVSPKREGRNATKLLIEIGTFVGLTEATPDWTGKLKASLTW